MNDLRPVTIDTGGVDDLFVGARVTWVHYQEGKRVPTRVKVLFFHAHTRERVTVQYMTDAGNSARRVVNVSELRWRVNA